MDANDRDRGKLGGNLPRTALGRLGHNSEVVGAAIYLAGEESSFTTGQCIHVNGGCF
jgi:NAD(P)-dependent dehydrogenase (short-subunit alcohol dehydrogenase family)